MICYLDFEANCTSRAQEIISIGAVFENGKTFYSLVHPRFPLHWRTEELTNVYQKDIDKAPSLDEVVQDFFLWSLSRQRKHLEFRVFGHCDRDFINSTIAMTNYDVTKTRLRIIRDAMRDVSGDIAQSLGCKHITLQDAYQAIYFPKKETHNALDDAKMLKEVCEYLKI